MNKSLWNSDDIADRKTERNDNALGIPRTNLELKYFHLFIETLIICSSLVSVRCIDKLLNEIGLATFITKQIFRFLFSQNIITCPSYHTDKYLFRVKSWLWLWSKSTMKTPERFHAVFIFNFEHIQRINLILYWIKSTKQLKCTLNNRVVSLKHVHVTWVSQYGLNNR